LLAIQAPLFQRDRVVFIAGKPCSQSLPRHKFMYSGSLEWELSPLCKTESPQFIFSPSALRNVLGTVQQDTDLQ
jgi:hypothetical protein